jgi:hypothetical protein
MLFACIYLYIRLLAILFKGLRNSQINYWLEPSLYSVEVELNHFSLGDHITQLLVIKPLLHF